jgi:WD40 repeat protein
MLIQVSTGRLEGHTDEVKSVAWSPSGERLASASGDKTVMVWDDTSGMQVTDAPLPLMLNIFSWN